MQEPPRFFCFGLGYSGLAIATALHQQGWQVGGTVRSADKAQHLQNQGISAFVFDRQQPLSDPAIDWLCGAKAVLSSVPTDADGDALLDEHSGLMARLRPQWFGYLSTTVVYGDWQGAWVDETCETRATTKRGLKRLEAEHRWATLGLPLHIFRLAGIYGPGRNALESLRRGTARRLLKPGQVFSRIHVDDISGAVRASMAQPTAMPGECDIFNLCDQEPCPPGDVIAYAAGLLGLEPPPLIPFDQAELSAMARSFYADNKRVDSAKLKRVLDYDLIHPSYRHGLLAELNRK